MSHQVCIYIYIHVYTLNISHECRPFSERKTIGFSTSLLSKPRVTLSHNREAEPRTKPSACAQWWIVATYVWPFRVVLYTIYPTENQVFSMVSTNNLGPRLISFKVILSGFISVYTWGTIKTSVDPFKCRIVSVHKSSDVTHQNHETLWSNKGNLRAIILKYHHMCHMCHVCIFGFLVCLPFPLCSFLFPSSLSF